MNNCPKCGNPLQAGISTCPICGTNINPINTVGVPQTPMQPNPVQSINVAPVQPQATPVMGAGQPMSNGGINMQPQTPINNVQPQQPVMQPNPVQPTQEVAPAPVQVEAAAPVVASEQAVSTPVTPEVEVKAPEVETNNQVEKTIELPKAKKESKLNKKTLIIIVGVIALIAIVAVVLILVLGKQEETKPTTGTNNTTNNNVVALKMSKVTSGGYIYNLPEAWTTQMSNNLEDIILVNEEGTVAISLDNFTGSLGNIDPEAIKTYLDASAYTDVNVTETTIGSRKCILVTGKYNNYPTQIYYIEDGTAKIVGAAIVYETEESKIHFEADVKTVMESVTYAEVSNAIDTAGLYGSIFRMFENTLLNSEKIPESSDVEGQSLTTQDTTTNDTTNTLPTDESVTNGINNNVVAPTN